MLRSPFETLFSIGRFRYIASHAERGRFARNSVWAFNLAPAFPRGALMLCPQLRMSISPRRYTEIGLLPPCLTERLIRREVNGQVGADADQRGSQASVQPAESLLLLGPGIFRHFTCSSLVN